MILAENSSFQKVSLFCFLIAIQMFFKRTNLRPTTTRREVKTSNRRATVLASSSSTSTTKAEESKSTLTNGERLMTRGQKAKAADKIENSGIYQHSIEKKTNKFL